MPPLVTRALAVLSAALFLAACQSSEERAEGHYQSALELAAEGDVRRAIVELRNVFEQNGQHREARLLLARLEEERGRPDRAVRQLLRVVEQYPEDVEGNQSLARLAMTMRNWDHIQRYGPRAVDLAPGDPLNDLVEVSLDYGTALEAEDDEARRAAVTRATELSAERPEELILRRIMVDGALQDEEFEAALAGIDEVIALDPQARDAFNTRLGILAELERVEDLRDTLEEMVERFPGDESIVANLMRVYLSQGEVDRAETFLRDHAAAGTGLEETMARQELLVQFLLERRGAEVALAELDRIVEGYAAAPPAAGEGAEAAGETAEAEGAEGVRDPAVVFSTLRASIRFALGQRETAIAELQDLLAQTPPGAAADDTRVALAWMLEFTGNRVGARRLVGEVLEADASHVGALKLEAGWLIEEDQVREAVAALRVALDADPEDTEAMHLMADAYLRDGNRNLARDFLALAVEASDAAPEESLRYAGFLIEEDRTALAEEILVDALRLQATDLDLLAALGQLHVRTEDWVRAEGIERRLRDLDRPEAARLADGLRAARLASQGRLEDTIEFLESLAQQNSDDIAAQIAIVRARLLSGDVEGARSYAEGLVENNPDDLVARTMLASTQIAVGEYAAAAGTYRGILDVDARIEAAWVGLVRALYAQGDVDSARAAVEEGLGAIPDAINLRWADATFLEQAGEYEAAIAVYETLYERVSDSLVIANNLASLLTTYRDDAESLARAERIARRLRESDVAPFQDTYGWILSRQGAHAEALEYLEPAAQTLERDPLVQYHLAATYDALDRRAEALEAYRRVVDLAGETDPRPQVAEALVRIEALEAAPEEAPETTAGQ